MSTARRRAYLLSAVVAAVATVAALLAAGLRHDPSVTTSPLVGRPAPDFALPALSGPDVRLADLRGQVVVVNFWASWCAECHTEQDTLNAVWDRYRDAGLVVVGVDFEDNDADARDYVARAGSTYPIAVDADSRTALAYGVRGVPETFVVDRDGRIVDRVIGAVDRDRLTDRLDRLLGGGAQ